MTKDEALRLALDALERSVATCLDPYSYEQVKSRPEHFINQTITALRFVIDAQNMASKSTYKEQLETKDEPVAYQDIKEKCKIEVVPAKGGLLREWVGLTKEEINQGLLRSFYVLEKARAWRDGVAWAEEILKEKNT